MPKVGPISRKDIVYYLRRLGFSDPQGKGKRQYMRRGATKLTVPNPHRGIIDERLLNIILKQGGISRNEWEAL
jgi:predicted RNA binding protein YcfA (HicA-like mRNA interferase family)